MKEHFKINKWFWIKFGIMSAIGIGIMCIYNGVSNQWSIIRYYCDGAFIAGFAIICISILILLESYGAFHMFSFYTRRKKLEDGRKENYSEYCQRHEKSRDGHRLSSFLPYFISGVVFIIVAVILYLCSGF